MIRGAMVVLLGAIVVSTGLRVAAHVAPGESGDYRAQPLIDLISTPVRRLVHSPEVAVADAQLAPRVEALLREGVPVNGWGKIVGSRSGITDFTPLMLASIRRFPRTVRVLTKAGAKLNETDRDGRTALIWAVHSGNSEVLKVLLAAGADPNHVDRRGRTAIDYAYLEGGAWDNQAALLRPLKRVKARPGPYEARKENPYTRFVHTKTRTGSLSQQTAGDGITFRSECTLTFPARQPPLLTREKYERLRKGMTYAEVAAVIGEDEAGGRMKPDYRGRFTFVEGSRKIILGFEQGKVATLAENGLPRST